MEVKIWEGGLQAQEIAAIREIQRAFSGKSTANSSDRAKFSRGGSLQDQLRQNGLVRNSMFPWKGYAGFRFVNSRHREGEFDLVIVTHCNVIIVELKDWNHQPITMKGDNWYKGNTLMGRSPVSITRDKKFTLDNKLKKLSYQFTNKGYPPFVEFFVVITGNSDFSRLPEDQRHHTLSLKEFLEFADQKVFNSRFRPHPNAQVLNQDFHIFDDLFLGNQIKPKALRFSGYEAKDKIFEHPNKIYSEYLASSEIVRNSEALLRVWNFNNLRGDKAFTPEGRAEIVSREREVLQYINHQNRDLYNHCLRALTSFQKDEVTAEYLEVYELPPSHMRLNEFIGKYGQSLSEQDRLNVIKLLIAKFGDLHEIKVAHRDIADHSLWISPSKAVALSNFISAYHQPIGTVGDYRKSLSVGAVELKAMLDGENFTPFQQDVHALALVAWHLITARRISPKSLESVRQEMLESDQWYAKVLLKACTAEYANAAELFDALKKAEPTAELIPTFDETELDPYRRPINHSRQYREDEDFLVETSDKEVYLSNGKLVKAWLNIGSSGDDVSLSFEVLSFLKKIDKLRAVKPPYLPAILDYGIAAKSSALYLVTDAVQGSTWDELELTEEEKLGVASKLISAVEQLHELGFSHGDLHPRNVMCDSESQDLYLIDIPDFSPSGNPPKNHRYTPENIDSCTSFERDNFAVMRMSCEMLGIAWGSDSEKYPHIASAIKAELEDPQFGFKDLGRFKKALTRRNETSHKNLVEVVAGSADAPVTILPDNGRLYVKVEPSLKDNKDVKVTFTGIGGTFSAWYSKEQRSFTAGLSPRVRTSVSKRDEEESHFELNASIRIVPGRPHQLSALSDLLRENDEFWRAVKLTSAVETPENTDVLTLELKAAFERLERLVTQESNQSVAIPTHKLWKAILDTEAESYPNIEVNGEVKSPPNETSALIIPYSAEVDPLGVFDSGDEVEALLIDSEGTERVIGEVSLKNSALNEVRLVKTRSGARSLKDGDTVFFRSMQDRASYRKRKAALERILNRGSILPNLVDLFDPGCAVEATYYNVEVTDSDFARYDRKDKHGNKISLNAQQREAFTRLVNYGPVSLLQGPPGTGKTEFIAAFVHYLIEKQQTKRILLVSQSHEAVNTAAERIRTHCSRLGTELEVVRFSNREGAVSAGLQDVYSNSLTSTRRALFEAEYTYRAEALSDALGLEPAFVSALLQAELKLFKQIDHLQSLISSEQTGANDEDIRQIKKITLKLDQTIRSKLTEDYDIILPSDSRLSDAKELVLSQLCNDYGVRPDEAKKARALSKVSRDMLDAWAGERVNCDEFYARSRQLITGTCVGIGKGHIGIQHNIYDWVIIDEAARSIASELAIAMQSAKRVLLVGDHLQLPPLYSEPHKKALARKLGMTAIKEELDEVLQSDFARAFNSVYGKQVSASLLTQYRMAPPIGNLVSEIFYGGRLENGDRVIPDVYEDAPEELQSVVTWIDTSDQGARSHHSEDRGTSIYNRCEADLIIDLLKRISSTPDFVEKLSSLTGEDEAAIGIICMYAEQKRILRQKFNQEVWSEGFKSMVKIDSVDSYQGKENRIIIVSLTRSDKQRSAGFLRIPNRINVALSRAMDRLLLVGNTDMWKFQNRDMPLGKVIHYMSEHGEQAGYKFLQSKFGGKK